jgi:hypothetical protein
MCGTQTELDVNQHSAKEHRRYQVKNDKKRFGIVAF